MICSPDFSSSVLAILVWIQPNGFTLLGIASFMILIVSRRNQCLVYKQFVIFFCFLQATFSVFELIGGPLLGIYSLGILFPFANSKVSVNNISYCH